MTHHPLSLTQPTERPRYGLEGLDAYRVAVELDALLVELARQAGRGNLVVHMLEASESTVLLIAEAHPAAGADRARRFRMAHTEASEAWAALQLLASRGAVRGPKVDEARELSRRLRAMLSRLGNPR